MKTVYGAVLKMKFAIASAKFELLPPIVPNTNGTTFIDITKAIAMDRIIVTVQNTPPLPYHGIDVSKIGVDV